MAGWRVGVRPATFHTAALALALLSASAQAQEGPPVVVVDQERLFEESQLGQEIAQELEERSAALAAENRAIEAELVAEERDLTERRSELEPSKFRELADAFDEKVERLRAAQDAKGRDLVALRDEERQNFTNVVGPILLDFMRESGASLMLDRRAIVVSSERIDVTEDLISEIDARVGARDASAREPSSDEAPSQQLDEESAD